jgi:hypothetical protein
MEKSHPTFDGMGFSGYGTFSDEENNNGPGLLPSRRVVSADFVKSV